MHVLVTGHTGFLGSHLVTALTERGHEVTGLSLSGGDGGIACDLTDADAARDGLAGVAPDAVVHLAGISSPAECARAPAAAFDANTRATWNLLDAVSTGGGTGKFLLGSSSAVYGGRGGVLDESLQPEPSTTYGASKAAAEVLAGQFGRWTGTPVVWARTFNLVGPGMPVTTLAGQVSAAIAAAEARGEREVTVGIRNPGHRRDFLDVRDAARALVLLLETDLDGPVNVCSGEGVEVAGVLETFRGLTEVAVGMGASDPGEGRPEAEPSEVVGSAGRIALGTGWAPGIDLDRSLGEAIEEFRQMGAG